MGTLGEATEQNHIGGMMLSQDYFGLSYKLIGNTSYFTRYCMLGQ